MKFFNPKQDVMDIQLTQYGKYLLSNGKFKPTYYAFFDDDILYDSEYASSMTEAQNNTETRIQNETPRLKTQYLYHGVETNINKLNDHVQDKNKEDEKQKITPTVEKSHTLTAPIGTSSPTSNYLPSWDIRFLNGEISGSVSYQSDSFSILRIPQIDVDITYEIVVKPNTFYDDSQSHPHGAGGYQFDTEHEFADNVSLSIKEDYLLIDIEEENSVLGKNNFEVEVFMVEDQVESNDLDGARKVLKPLSFQRSKSPGLMEDDEIITEGEIDDPSYVGYYLEFAVDNDMSQEEVSRTTRLPKKAKSIYDTPQQSIVEEEC